MTILHKQISPVGPTGIESETWDTYKLMRHLELIGPDKHLPAKNDDFLMKESESRKARKKRIEDAKFYEAPNGKRVSEVPGHRHYYATEDGEIYSGRQGKLTRMKVYKGKFVTLQGNYGQTTAQVDRLVALAWD